MEAFSMIIRWEGIAGTHKWDLPEERLTEYVPSGTWFWRQPLFLFQEISD